MSGRQQYLSDLVAALAHLSGGEADHDGDDGWLLLGSNDSMCMRISDQGIACDILKDPSGAGPPSDGDGSWTYHVRYDDPIDETARDILSSLSACDHQVHVARRDVKVEHNMIVISPLQAVQDQAYLRGSSPASIVLDTP